VRLGLHVQEQLVEAGQLAHTAILRRSRAALHGVRQTARRDVRIGAVSDHEPFTGMYRFAMGVCTPIVRTWGRLEVSGLELLPRSGPTLVAGNHDSYWDPVAVGVAALGHRQVRALAKDELWNVTGLKPVLDGMGQIPIKRGKQDHGAMARAVEELRNGACIGVFPEGTRSRGKELRPRSGIGRLALEVPEARLVLVAITGTVDVPRFPKRPRIRVAFFEPEGGSLQPGEELGAFSARIVEQLRAVAPRVACGRRPQPVQA
jgi:1-acyl-sn-glycerol-3-phosphate acyltransferase